MDVDGDCALCLSSALIVVVRLTTVANREAAARQVELNALKQQEKGLMDAAQAVKNDLSPEQQLAVPSAHELIDRKKFSWSRLLADLETSLPGNVRVSRIAVRVTWRRKETRQWPRSIWLCFRITHRRSAT